jgi:hypothetical protein
MNHDEKNELLKNIHAAKDIGQNYIVIGRELQKEGQRLKDEAGAAESVILYPFEGIDYSEQRALWGGVVVSGEDNLAHFEFRVPLEGTSGSSIARLFNNSPDLVMEAQNFNPETKKGAQIAIANLCHQVETVNTKDETILLLKKFGFDRGHGDDRSPLTLFEVGYAAYENPVTEENPSVTSLIPVRSCIDSMVADLLRRRPSQEPAQGKIKKIQSIAEQMKFDIIIVEVVNHWANEYHELSDVLSTAKTKSMDRNEWRIKLQRAMNFIIGFLKILDPEKIRNTQGD